MTADEDHQSMEALPRDACLQLLADHAANVGRVAVAGTRPDILPVNYVLDEGAIVFRTEEGKKLDAAVRGQFVAFEVDDVDPEWRTGWSVVVRGWAEEVVDPAALERMRGLPLQPWAPGTRGHYVRIRPETVSGRRIR